MNKATFDRLKAESHEAHAKKVDANNKLRKLQGLAPGDAPRKPNPSNRASRRGMYHAHSKAGWRKRQRRKVGELPWVAKATGWDQTVELGR